MQAVGRDQVAGRRPVDQHPVVVLGDRPHRAVLDRHAGGLDGLVQAGVQRGPAYAASGAGAEPRLGGAAPVEVADALDVLALRVQPEPVERGHGAGQQPLAAGLVDRSGARLAEHDVEAGAGRDQGGGEADGASSGHHQVPHPAATDSRRARSSTRIRVVSSAALSTVKPSAVIHAPCTSGRATPSTTTAT